MLSESTKSNMLAAGTLIAASAFADGIEAPSAVYKLECRDKHGNIKWVERFKNLVTTAGKTDIVDKYLKGSSYTAAWYMGLKGVGTASVNDTLASHAGWTELTPYTGNRKAIMWGTTTGGSNTAAAVSFAITSSATVAGAFIANVDTGTSGVLYSVGDFSVSRSVVSGDTLNVTATLSVS